MLKGKSILITGGTGSFGQVFVRYLLRHHPELSRIIVFSRDEFKQVAMARTLRQPEGPALQFMLGDVRDERRLRQALQGVHYVVHSAALKQVPQGERHPDEYIATNITGAQNLIEAMRSTPSVERVIALSTSKSVSPVNLYGATKLASDKLFLAANPTAEYQPGPLAAVVRFGNMIGSRGSVVPYWQQLAQEGRIPLTHPDMTRFSITIEEVAATVVHALTHAAGGEIFVPKSPSYRIVDLAAAVCPDCQHEWIGIRPGEKLHEELISQAEAGYTLEQSERFLLLPMADAATRDALAERHGGRWVAPDFAYTSDQNDWWLSVAALRPIIEALKAQEPVPIAEDPTAS
jgi:FlaA1/EpsC-like NDP-sugar epimerase